MAMLTRSLHFTKPQAAYLQTEADKLGISVSELIRRIVDEWRERLEKSKPDRRLHAKGKLKS